MDIRELSVGTNLNENLAKAIKNSKAVICCITRAYDKSENCIQEINWAKLNKKPLIVLMFEDVDVTELESVGFIIAPLLRINLFEDKQVINSWNGPKFDELIKAINNALSLNFSLTKVEKVCGVFKFFLN